MKLNDEILKIHEQKHSNSCVPSAVEMVLKLHGLIKPNDFYLQEHFKEKISGGHIVDFFNKDYPEENKNIKFYQKEYDNLESYFDAIKKELSNRYVLIPLKNSNGGYHEYVVYDYLEKEGFKAVTRCFQNKEIVYVNDMEERFRKNFCEMINKKQKLGVDILVYNMSIRVIYSTESKIDKNQGKAGKIGCERFFDSVEKAKAAPLPEGCVFACIKVKDGHHAYSRELGWEFMSG